jgi:anti-anti-sigma regulatory factor
VVTPPETQPSTRCRPTCFVIRGEVDLANYDEVSRLLHEHLDVADSDLRIDLSEVTFFSAAGVRALLEASDVARRLGVTSGSTPSPQRRHGAARHRRLRPALPL